MHFCYYIMVTKFLSWAEIVEQIIVLNVSLP